MPPRVLLVASEALPLVKTGGLADVVSAMAQALHTSGIEVTLMLPAYPGALAALGSTSEVARFDDLACGHARLLRGTLAPLPIPVLLFESEGFRLRTGNPYVNADGDEYPDNAIAFASLCQAAARICAGKTAIPVPHVVHANDWHAALIPALLRTHGVDNVGTVLTIHNLAFQGNYSLDLAQRIGLTAEMSGPEGAEFWGKLSYLKAGIRYADRISIVSHSYAGEVLTPRFGCGMDGVLNLRRDAIVPIPNGVDVQLWNPSSDSLIARPFSAQDMRNKAWCKRALLKMFELPVIARAPLLALGSRITHQKMADVALDALPTILEREPRLQVVVLGCGDRRYENGFRELAQRFEQRVAVRIGYDESCAHALHAGADMLLHGTRFEPFGLTPIYSMRYGTIPIASRVGGIIDTVIDAGSETPLPSGASGVLFDGERTDDMVAAIERALTLYGDSAAWKRMQRNAMRGDFSWRRPAREYIALYRDLAPRSARVLFDAALAGNEPAADCEQQVNVVAAVA